MQMIRKLIPLLVPTTLGLLLAGCVSFSAPPTASQLASGFGTVTLHASFCPNGSPAAIPTQPSPSACASDSATFSEPTYLLIGFRVPAGLVAPSSFTTPSVPGIGSPLTVTQSSSYTSELNADNPAAAGQTWIGNESSPAFNGGAPFPATATSIDVPFTLSGAEAAPLASPMSYQVVVGYTVQPSSSTEPKCTDGGVVPTVCIENSGTGTASNASAIIGPPAYPAYSQLADQSARLSFVSHDLMLAASTVPAVEQGATMSVPFKLSYQGPTLPAGTVTFSASTTASGVTVTPASSSFTATGNSTLTVNVDAAVAAGVVPGSYPVTLTASTADGFTRTATAMLTVFAAPAAPRAPASPVPFVVAASGALKHCADTAKMCAFRAGVTLELGGVIQGSVNLRPDVRISLVRHDGRRCTVARGDGFHDYPCSAASKITKRGTVTVGVTTSSWSSTFPATKPGRYVLNVTAQIPGSSARTPVLTRVSFRVR